MTPDDLKRAGVRVRPLAWSETLFHNGLEAQGIRSHYLAVKTIGGWIARSNAKALHDGFLGSQEEACAACEADQAEIILSALEPTHELTTLTARTREVLAPFAAAIEHYDKVWDEQTAGQEHADGEDADHVTYCGRLGDYVDFSTIGDFRAARSLFNELKEKDNG